MAEPRVFISQDWPTKGEVEWAHRFADALRGLGFDVFEEWSPAANPSQESIERALRESDLIVLLISTRSARSPSFLFEYGVALGGDKEIIAVIPSNMDPELLPIRPLRERRVTKSSPERTAAAVAARLRELRVA